MQKASIGIIGGSGLYEIDSAKTVEEMKITTPWGEPSDTIVIADIDGHRAAFLPRHGKGHLYCPHEVNFRANIAALKMIGVTEVVAFSASGSLKEEIRPLDFVLPDQIIDRTRGRASTFFGNGVVGHITFAAPFCGRLQGIIKQAASSMGLTMHTGETLICMEGPAFSTKAESNLYRSWGAGVINMSTLPEAKLAREAEMCYAVICMSTDYDCWHETEESVTIDMVLRNLTTNAGNAKNLIKLLLEMLGKDRKCECGEASKYAIITDEKKRSRSQAKKLKAILPNYF
jgi:5'-methylthioadenosine phosphorylase